MNHQNNFILSLISLFLLSSCAMQPTQPITKNDLLKNPCWQYTLKKYGATHTSLMQGLNREIANYQVLAEQALTYRANTMKLTERLEDNIKRKNPLSGADLDELNRVMVRHLDSRQKFHTLAEAHECWIDASPEIFKQLSIEPFALENQLKGVMLSISAALLLYDNYLLAISKFEKNAKLRFLLNQGDRGYGLDENKLAKLTREYTSLKKRKRLERGLEFFEQNLLDIPAGLQEDPQFSYLKLLIEQSPFYGMNKQFSVFYILSKRLEYFGVISGDTLHRFVVNSVNEFSKLFGNSVGLVETRKGKLYKRPEIVRSVVKELQPGDILLEKTPFRLTDKFIPGHWGHAAIWLGTEAELKKLGIWNHSVVKRYQKQISEGRSIVEALRPGVQLSFLEDFMNIDDLAILRDASHDLQAQKDHIILALRQVGKAYDFNFDVETTDKIVCSELIYVVFTKIKWPTEKALGRFTISPDNVASKAFDKGPLKLVLFFHDGNRVTNNTLNLMQKLMGYPRKMASLPYDPVASFDSKIYFGNRFPSMVQ